VLKIHKIDVYYGDLKAVSDISLTVEDGEILVLIGSNGAGKSTILKAICGLLRPATGSIYFNGLRLDQQPVHTIVQLGISMVREERRVFPEMTVLENLELGAFVGEARQSKNETMNRVYELFPILRGRNNQKAGTLSGGEQQMLVIGRALMSRPKLLLLDELSLGLAPLMIQNILKVIQQIHESTRISILLVEQHIDMALLLADRGYIIENGQIVMQGEAKSLLTNQKVRDTYFGLV
jgi:branched-chain amino acid transport system ATP-binding protein